jgi:hypothetical protein
VSISQINLGGLKFKHSMLSSISIICRIAVNIIYHNNVLNLDQLYLHLVIADTIRVRIGDVVMRQTYMLYDRR